MGGPNSGRWRGYQPRATVEQTLTLSADRLTRQGILRPRHHATGKQQWVRAVGGGYGASVEYEADTRDMSAPWLHLWYRLADAAIDYRVGLTSLALPYGLRWFFLCPCCGRRAGMLHRHPSADRFACRSCQRLTYTSCQDSHRANGLYRMLYPALPPAVARRLLVWGMP